MFVSYIAPEMNLGAIEEEGGGDGVHGCVAPAFVVESTGEIEGVEERRICWAAPEIEGSKFEV